MTAEHPGYVPITDLATPLAARLVAQLGIPQQLRAGARAAADLARAADVDPDALTRLLRFLAVRGVFTEVGDGVFGLTAAAFRLLPDAEEGIAPWLDVHSALQVVGFYGLAHSVRTGRSGWEKAVGRSFWDYLHGDRDRAGRFDEDMAGDLDLKRDAVRGYDWSDGRVVVDVGGGSGALLTEILRTNPHSRGVLVDLPATVEQAAGCLGGSGLIGRCELIAQSFFDELPRGGDVYVLCGILADWPDEDAVRILHRCAEALDPGGRIVVIEHPTDPADQRFIDLSLLVLLLMGGKIRTLDELGSLAGAAGLRVSSSTVTDGGQFVVELRAQEPAE